MNDMSTPIRVYAPPILPAQTKAFQATLNIFWRKASKIFRFAEMLAFSVNPVSVKKKKLFTQSKIESIKL